MYLYLDTSHFLALGLLDHEFSWLEYERREQLQHSADIHALIFKMLEKRETEALNLKGIIICNGPGSYTGIRLGEGIAQLFELGNIPVYSFHHYQVPKILDNNSYVWVSHAFKGEVFSYRWNGNDESYELTAASEWKPVDGETIFSHQPQGPWDKFDFKDTMHLIKQSAVALFGYVLSEKMRLEPYYFRPLDKEFKRSVE